MAAQKKIKKTVATAKKKKIAGKKKTSSQGQVAGKTSRGGSAAKKPGKTGSQPQKTASRGAGGKTAKKAVPATQRGKRPPLPVKKVLPRTAAGTGRKKTGESVSSMSKERIELLKKQLIQRRESIVREAQSEIGKYIKGEANQLVETALDDGDWSVIDLSEDINFKRLESHRESLLRIDEALRKLQEGTYGRCEDCGEEVAPERLRVLPFAIFCRDCQEKREEFEKATRVEVI